jgi:WD40 repeat protein
MQLAPHLWKDDRTTARQLGVLLGRHLPDDRATPAKPDLRGFEWYYYQHLLEKSAAVFSGHGATAADPSTPAANWWTWQQAFGALTSSGQLVTLDQNGQLSRWDLGSEDEDEASRRDLPGGPSAELRVLSPDGRLAALAEGNRAHVFDTATGQETFQVESANDRSRRLVFSRDGDRLVIIDNKIRWLSAQSGDVIASVDRKYDFVSNAALSADGLMLAVVGYSRSALYNQWSIFLLDASKRTVTQDAKGTVTLTVSASSLSPDGQRIAFGQSLSGMFGVLDTATGRVIAQHTAAHASPISAIAFSGDGAKLVTADTQGTIKVWADIDKLTTKSVALRTLKGHQGAINTVGFSEDARRLVSVGADNTARVWDLENAGAAIRPLERCGRMCYGARFSPDGQLIAAADAGGVHLWDAATGRLVRDLPAGDKSAVLSVAFSPTDSRLLAVGYGGRKDVSYVALWDIAAGSELARLPGASDLPGLQMDEFTGAAGALAFSPDGKYLVVGFGKGAYESKAVPHPLKVWEVATRQQLRLLNGHTGYCVSLGFSRDGAMLASSSHDGRVILWSTETWEAVRTLENPDRGSQANSQAGRRFVDDAAFSPDGKTLAMASRAGNVQLWNVATGELLDTLKGHSSAVQTVVFSLDGRTLASGSSDQTVRLWNVETRRELMQLDPGSVELGGVYTLAFSPDGKHLLAGGSTSTAFWSAAPIRKRKP